jgi:hypothetical protein
MARPVSRPLCAQTTAGMMFQAVNAKMARTMARTVKTITSSLFAPNLARPEGSGSGWVNLSASSLAASYVSYTIPFRVAPFSTRNELAPFLKHSTPIREPS